MSYNPYLTYYSNQIGGSGDLEGYRGGPLYKRAAGLGSIFGKLFRTIIPIAKKLAPVARRAVARHAKPLIRDIAADVLEGRNVGESIKSNVKNRAVSVLRKRKRTNTKRKPAKRQRTIFD